MPRVGDQKNRMLSGQLYRCHDPELAAERLQCRQMLDKFNVSGAEEKPFRRGILEDLLGSIGEGSSILPSFRCEYGYLIEIGRDCCLNYDAIILDGAKVVIGDNVQIGPRAQIITALHPVADHELRREGWETVAPVTIGDNAWFGAGVIVCPGVTIGANTVVGAGSVVTRDLPEKVFAAGSPARVIKPL